jgi:hypothetical protein
MPVGTGNFLIETTNKVTIHGIKDSAGVYMNDATMQGTLYNKNAVVENGSNLTFSLVSGSVTGDYEGILPHTLALTENTSYDLYLTAARSGVQMTVRVRRTAKYLEA